VESPGKAAERVVAERVGAALPADAYHPYPNAEWLGSMRDDERVPRPRPPGR
jgi:hypothetical protein